MKLQEINLEIALKEGLTGVSGKVYKVTDKICVDRFVKMRQYETEMFQTGGYSELVKSLQVALDYFDDGKASKAIQTMYQMQELAFNSIQETPIHMKMCALFLNHEDEDQTEYSETNEIEKIKDWKNYNCLGFFPLAATIVPGLKQNFRTALEAAENNKDIQV